MASLRLADPPDRTLIAVIAADRGQDSYDLVDKYLSINSFWNENDFNGLPKIVACAEP
jgi:hypothetical protein